MGKTNKKAIIGKKIELVFPHVLHFEPKDYKLTIEELFSKTRQVPFWHFCILLSVMIAYGYLYLCAKYLCHQIFRNICIFNLKSSFAHQMLRNSKLQSLIPNICQNGFGSFCKRALYVYFMTILIQKHHF